MNRFEAGFRREVLGDPDDVPSDPILVERIRAEIEAGGPISFARFMALALYEPGHGYYRSAEARPGRGGDFLTAPEAHPVFGWTLARQLDELWRVLDRPDPFTLRELGGGSGTLVVAILEGLERAGSPLVARLRYEPLEAEAARTSEIERRLGAAGHAKAVVAAPERGRPIVGAVLANEVLDALPVHRVVGRAGGVREILVGWRDGAFVDVEAEPSTAALAERLAAEGIDLAEGQHAEVSLAVDGWVAGAATGLARGLLLLIDYGADAPALYDGVRRPQGTLRAFSRHRLSGDVYARVGRQDLTAHVDVTAVERAAERAGLARLGVTSQGEFLVGAGAEELLVAVQQDPATTLEAYAALRSVLVRLVDPGGMGGFRVMGFGRGLPAGVELRGFSFRLRR